jgi:predicted MFS family arabinose efflux permease
MATQEIRKIFTRDFIFVFISQFTFSVAYHVLYPTLPIYLSRLGITEVDIGILVGTVGVSSLIVRPFIGRALLKTPEKHFMLGGALFSVLSYAAYLFAPPFWPLFIVRILHGLGLAFFFTASFTFVSNISADKHRGQTFSYYLLSTNISLAISPSLGMFIINRFHFAYLFLLCLGLSLCCFFAAGKLGRREPPPEEPSLANEGYLFNRKALPPSILAFFFHFTWGALAAFFPLYAVRHGVANPGLFFTVVAVMLISGRASAGNIIDRYNREKVILPCLILCIISMAILAFSESLPMFMLVAVIWGMGHAFLFPSLAAHAVDKMGASRGTGMGTFTGLSDLGISLGPVAMGIVIHFTGYPTMFLCLALTGTISLTYFYFFVREKG